MEKDIFTPLRPPWAGEGLRSGKLFPGHPSGERVLRWLVWALRLRILGHSACLPPHVAMWPGALLAPKWPWRRQEAPGRLRSSQKKPREPQERLRNEWLEKQRNREFEPHSRPSEGGGLFDSLGCPGNSVGSIRFSEMFRSVPIPFLPPNASPGCVVLSIGWSASSPTFWLGIQYFRAETRDFTCFIQDPAIRGEEFSVSSLPSFFPRSLPPSLSLPPSPPPSLPPVSSPPVSSLPSSLPPSRTPPVSLPPPCSWNPWNPTLGPGSSRPSLDERVVQLLVPSLGPMRCVTCASFLVRSSAIQCLDSRGYLASRRRQEAPGRLRSSEERLREPGEAQEWLTREAEKPEIWASGCVWRPGIGLSGLRGFQKEAVGAREAREEPGEV